MFPELGAILVDVHDPAIPYDAWLRVIATCPNLAEMEAAIGINPFTRKPLSVRRPYAAWVLINGERAGSMVWEADVVHVAGDADRILPLARDVARQLGASFHTWAEVDALARSDDAV